MTEYSKKLKDPRWQKKRLEIFERDKWMCTQCLSIDKTLHVHHLDYLANHEPWEYDNSFLITLCEECHTDVTESLPIAENELLSQLRLALKYPIVFSLASEVIKQYDDALIQLLFENLDRKEQVIKFLKEISR